MAEAGYSVQLARSARKELESLDTKLVGRIFPRIQALATEPRPPGCRKLRGRGHLWRIRIGEYRVIYAVDDASRIVDIIAVRHRREAY